MTSISARWLWTFLLAGMAVIVILWIASVIISSQFTQSQLQGNIHSFQSLQAEEETLQKLLAEHRVSARLVAAEAEDAREFAQNTKSSIQEQNVAGNDVQTKEQALALADRVASTSAHIAGRLSQ